MFNFDGEFTALFDYVRRQPWADTNRMAWVLERFDLEPCAATAGGAAVVMRAYRGGWLPQKNIVLITRGLR